MKYSGWSVAHGWSGATWFGTKSAEQGLEAEQLAEDEPRTWTGNGARGRRVENAPLPGRDDCASGREVWGFAGGRAGRRWGRKIPEPSLFGGRSTRFDSLALRTARKRRRRAMVAVEVRATGRSIPIRDAMQSLFCRKAGDGALGVKPWSTAAQAADRGGPYGPGGTKSAQADGILGTV